LYEVMYGLVVRNNRFINILEGGGHLTTAGHAVLLYPSGSRGVAHDTVIDGNYYRNTSTSIGEGGMVYWYGAQGMVITNNVCYGSWTSSYSVQGPCFAPGRVLSPNDGSIIANNYVEGFNAFWDADSMINTEVYGNIIVRCGSGLNTGYGIQRYVNIHHNTSINSTSTTYGGVGSIFANGSAVQSSFTDNVIIDDRGISAPTGVIAALQSGGSLTVGTPYFYKVTALDRNGETVGSSEVTATPTSGNQKIRVTWNYIVGAVSYKLYRSTTSGTYGAINMVGRLSEGTSNVWSDGPGAWPTIIRSLSNSIVAANLSTLLSRADSGPSSARETVSSSTAVALSESSSGISATANRNAIKISSSRRSDSSIGLSGSASRTNVRKRLEMPDLSNLAA
jgi:hypothetical protein